MRALLIHHPYTYPRFEQDFVDRIGERPEFDVVAADLDALQAGLLRASDREIDLKAYDAVVAFLAFNRLRRAEPVSWEGFDGLRVLMDHDIIQNYSDIFDPTLQGTWPPEVRRHRFDSVVTSGGVIRDRLEAEGISADWIPKAVEPSRFFNDASARSGVVTYGSKYLCRKVAEQALRDADLPLVRIDTTPYPKLGSELGAHLACLAVSADLEVPVESRANLLDDVARNVPMRPGLEPMAKLFEGAAAGCCPVVDAMADLEALGFRDGDNALTFRSFDELVGKARWAVAEPGQVMAMGDAASRLCADRHTWAHRADALGNAVRGRL